MARVTDNILTRGLRGKIGKDTVFKKINGETYQTSPPDRTGVKYNKEQLAYRKLFAAAARYASAVLHDPGKASAYLEKGISRDQLYNAALKDFFQKNSWEKPLTLSDRKQAEWLRKFPGLNNRQMKAAVHLMTKGRLTNALYRKINSVSKPTATRELQDLAGRGVIVSNGVKGAGSKYLIPEQGRG